MLISEAYLSLNENLHKSDNYGSKGDKWSSKVKELIESLQPSSILDYGCGKGALARSLQVKIAEYDPAIEGKQSLPSPASLVICTDVLEHIEPELLNDVLDHLEELTQIALFAVICTRPAKKVLADGRNAHLIVEDWSFWEKQLSKRFKIKDVKIHGKELEVLLFSRRSA